MMKNVRLLIVKFNNQISKNEITSFRSAVLQALKKEESILFHNHVGTKFRYAYPLIQYKRINQKAAIVAINEGTESIGKLFSNLQVPFPFEGREEQLEIASINASQYLTQIWNSSFTYIIRRWLPLNQENYDEYQQIEGLADRLAFLDRILIGNILSFAKGVGIKFEKEITCQITQLKEPKLAYYKNVKMLSFDAEFKTNVSIPNLVGIGKGASLNFGTVVMKNDQKKQDN